MQAVVVCLWVLSFSDKFGDNSLCTFSYWAKSAFSFWLVLVCSFKCVEATSEQFLWLTPKLCWAETLFSYHSLFVPCYWAERESNGPCWLILAATLPLWMDQAQLCSVTGRVSRIHRLLLRSHGVCFLNQRHTNTCKLQFSPLALHFLISFSSLFS